MFYHTYFLDDNPAKRMRYEDDGAIQGSLSAESKEEIFCMRQDIVLV